MTPGFNSRNLVSGTAAQRMTGVAVFVHSDQGLQITFIAPEDVDTEIKDKVRAVIESYARDGNTVGAPEGPHLDPTARTTVVPTQCTTEGACDTSTRKSRTTSQGQQLSIGEPLLTAENAANPLRTTYSASASTATHDAQRIADDFEAVKAILRNAMRTTSVPRTDVDPIATTHKLQSRSTGARVIEAQLVTERYTTMPPKMRTTVYPIAENQMEPAKYVDSAISPSETATDAPEMREAIKFESDKEAPEVDAHPRIDIMPTEVISESRSTRQPGRSSTIHQPVSVDSTKAGDGVRISAAPPHGSRVAVLRTTNASESAQVGSHTLFPVHNASRTSTSPAPVEIAAGRSTTAKNMRNDKQESMSAASSSKPQITTSAAVTLAIISSAFIAH